MPCNTYIPCGTNAVPRQNCWECVALPITNFQQLPSMTLYTSLSIQRIKNCSLLYLQNWCVNSQFQESESQSGDLKTKETNNKQKATNNFGFWKEKSRDYFYLPFLSHYHTWGTHFQAIFYNDKDEKFDPLVNDKVQWNSRIWHTPNTERFNNTKADANLTSPFLVRSQEMTVAHVDLILYGLHTLQGN